MTPHFPSTSNATFASLLLHASCILPLYTSCAKFEMTDPTDAATADMSNLTVNPNAPKGKAKRDALRSNEIEVQAMWERENVFESDAADDGKEKFIVTFPFPYSNGHLHIGHAFSLTKSVFRAQFERHMGKNVLFPFAFHCTGMPIQAVSSLASLACFVLDAL